MKPVQPHIHHPQPTQSSRHRPRIPPKIHQHQQRRFRRIIPALRDAHSKDCRIRHQPRSHTPLHRRSTSKRGARQMKARLQSWHRRSRTPRNRTCIRNNHLRPQTANQSRHARRSMIHIHHHRRITRRIQTPPRRGPQNSVAPQRIGRAFGDAAELDRRIHRRVLVWIQARPARPARQSPVGVGSPSA